MRLAAAIAACKKAGIVEFEQTDAKGVRTRLVFAPQAPAETKPPPAREPDDAKPAPKARPKAYDLLFQGDAS